MKDKEKKRFLQIFAVVMITVFLAGEMGFALEIPGADGVISTLAPGSPFVSGEGEGLIPLEQENPISGFEYLGPSGNFRERAALAKVIRYMGELILRYSGRMSAARLAGFLQPHIPEGGSVRIDWPAMDKKGSIFSVPVKALGSGEEYSLIYELSGQEEVKIAVRRSGDRIRGESLTADRAYEMLEGTGMVSGEGLDAAFRLAKAIEGYPIRGIAVVGSGLRDLPILLSLMGKKVVFVDMDPRQVHSMASRDRAVMKRLGEQRTGPVSPVRYLHSEIGGMDLADMGLSAGSFDLVTFADMIGPVPAGDPAKWFLKAGELLGESGYILLDDYDMGQHRVFETFRQVFPMHERSAGGTKFEGMYNGSLGGNRLYFVTTRSEESGRDTLREEEKEIWKAWDEARSLPVEITGIMRYASGIKPSGFKVSYKGTRGFVHKKDTTIDFSAPEETLKYFVGTTVEMAVVDPGDRGKKIQPRFSMAERHIRQQGHARAEGTEKDKKLRNRRRQVPRNQSKNSKVNRLSYERLKRQMMKEDIRDMYEEGADDQIRADKRLPEGSPLEIFRLLREEGKFVFPEDIRLRTKGKMPDGHLSVETVKRDLGTLCYLGLVEKFGLGEDSVYIALERSLEYWHVIEILLAELGTRPGAAEKRSTRERIAKKIRMAEELDKRPSEAKLLHPVYVADDMAIKAIVNPDSLPLTAVYGGAGTDLSNFLLSTNATEGYFISYNEGLKVFEAPSADAYRPLEDPDAVEDVSEWDAMVYRRKFSRGFSVAWDIISADERILALALELEAIGASDVKVDLHEGFPRLRFKWAYYGEQEKDREITFIEADMTDPGSYPGLLREVFERGVDIYYQRAALRMPKAYLGENNFIEYIHGHLSKGGFFVTDDYSFREDGPDSPENYTARYKDFPIELEEISVPGRGFRTKVISDLRKGRGSKSYGWELLVRRRDERRIQHRAAGRAKRGSAIKEKIALEEQFRRDDENPLLGGLDHTVWVSGYSAWPTLHGLLKARFSGRNEIKGFDLGAGSGWITGDIDLMLQDMFRKVVFAGIEIDPYMAEAAGETGIPMVQGNAVELPAEVKGDRIDLVTIINPNPRTLEDLAGSAIELIAPGGMVIIKLAQQDMDDLMKGEKVFGVEAASIRKILWDFIMVELDTASPEWKIYMEQYPELYNDLESQPFLFVYSPGGEEMVLNMEGGSPQEPSEKEKGESSGALAEYVDAKEDAARENVPRNTQEFIDELINWAEKRAVDVGDRNETLVIGVDTSWIPDEQLAMSGMSTTLRRLEIISKSGIRGFSKIKVCIDSDPGNLARKIQKARKAENGGELTRLSNVVIISRESVLKSGYYEGFKDPKTGESAFFAKVRLPRGIKAETDIDIVLLTARVLEKVSAMRSGREFYIDLPSAGKFPIHRLDDIYKVRSEALIRA